MKDIFEQLFKVLKERKQSSQKNSYVSSLYQEGAKKITEKITEESKEVIEEALEKKFSKKNLTHEICDLLFHSFVLAQYYDIGIDDIKNELNRRFGTSGIIEKESRKK